MEQRGSGHERCYPIPGTRFAILFRMRSVLPFLFVLAGCGQVGMDETVATDTTPWLSFDPAGSVSFGRVSPNGSPEKDQVTLISNGDSDVGVADAWIEADPPHSFYFPNELPFPMVMAPGDSVPLVIDFSPDATGSFGGTLVLQLENGQIIERALTGTGCSDTDRDGECG